MFSANFVIASGNQPREKGDAMLGNRSESRTTATVSNIITCLATLGVFGTTILVACNGKSPVSPSTLMYHVTVNAQTGGTIVAPATSRVSAAPGITIAIKAQASPGYAFARWIVAGDSVNIGYSNSSSTTAMLFSDNDTLTAQFVAINSVLSPIDNSAFQKEQGASYAYFSGAWTSLPDFSALTPDSAGPCDSINVAALPYQANHFGVVFTGYFNAPFDGTYMFYLQHSDGSQLLINDSIIINDNAIHASPVEDSASITLTEGAYLIEIRFFDSNSIPTLIASYSCPAIGIDKTTISSSALTRPYSGPASKITVVKPSGGETFHLGDTLRVQWIYKNPRGQVFVGLSVDGGKSYSTICPLAIPGNINTYAWPIPPGADSLVTQTATVMVNEYPPYNLNGISKSFSIVK